MLTESIESTSVRVSAVESLAMTDMDHSSDIDDCPPTKLEPLFGPVVPDVLQLLCFAPDSNVLVTFMYAGYDISVQIRTIVVADRVVADEE